jgi:parallel beta-helix repeat protein
MKKYIFIFTIYFLAINFMGCTGVSRVKEGPLAAIDEAAYISGIIKEDTTLGGVVTIIGDVCVPKGVTLTILPGTKVIVKKTASTKIEPLFLSSKTEILIKGSIVAKGTKEQKITFLSDQKDGGQKDYAGIILYQNRDAFFENCIFKNAQTAVYAIRSRLRVAESEFEDCLYAISTNNATFHLEGNNISSCDKGFYFHKNSQGIVTNSEFTGCAEDAVFIDRTSELSVYKNVFTDNLWGISTIEPKGEYIKNNEFINNQEDVKPLNY